MKELTIEEKAKRYDEAKLRMSTAYNSNRCTIGFMNEIFPELRESEDERIRKSLIDMLKNDEKCYLKEIAWLEKQEEQELNDDEDILQRFSFYSYKDEQNILYLSELYVNEEYRNKGIGTKILEVADEVAKSLNCNIIRLKTKKDSNAERLYRTHGYNSLATEESDEIWLEKQGGQKSDDKIQLGKKYKCIASPKYSTFMTGKIYKPEDKFLCKLMNFCYDCFEPIEDDEQKVEPKFKVGDWVIYDHRPYQVVELPKEGYINLGLRGNGKIEFAPYTYCKHWTIQDAKDGDVLCTYECGKPKIVFILKGTPKKHYALSYHCYYNIMYPHFESDSEKGCLAPNDEDVKPASKEQRNQLEKAIADAGYTFDFEKKELKKIEQKPADNANLVINILNNENRKVQQEDLVKKPSLITVENESENYKQQIWSEEDTRLLDNCINLIEDIDCTKEEQNFLKSLKNRIQPQSKHGWSEEDDIMARDIDYALRGQIIYPISKLHSMSIWIDNLKDRVQPKQEWKRENIGYLTEFENLMMHRGNSFFGDNAGLDPNDTNTIKEQANLLLELVPKQEWSEEDEKMIQDIINDIAIAQEQVYCKSRCEDEINWLKSLRPHSQWKPSDEQIEAMQKALVDLCGKDEHNIITGLYYDLKKLKEE